MRGRVVSLAAMTALPILAACTASTSTPTPTRSLTETTTITRSASPAPTRPVDTGPTTAASGTCPFISEPAAMDAVGQRLARQRVLKSGGRIVGCRFYALQNSPLHTSENLPGPDQPVVEITTTRYPSATAAHNAVVALAEAGSHYQQIDIPGGFAVIFQTEFDPADGNRDWACAFSSGSTLVVIRTANDDQSVSVVQIARTVAANVRDQ